jgi:twitching motility protein PilU
MERDQAVRLTQNLLKKMVEQKGSDLFITADFPPAIKIDGAIKPFADRPLTAAQSSLIVRSIMNDKQAKEFDATKESNFAIAPQGIGRFRVSAFVQQGNAGAVIRTIVTKIPTFEDLDLPLPPGRTRPAGRRLARDAARLWRRRPHPVAYGRQHQCRSRGILLG